jgi:hypothetical protein
MQFTLSVRDTLYPLTLAIKKPYQPLEKFRSKFRKGDVKWGVYFSKKIPGLKKAIK